jgi:hypothetical protein
MNFANHVQESGHDILRPSPLHICGHFVDEAVQFHNINLCQDCFLFSSQISGLASQVKKDKRVLNSALTKIVNYGVPI